jgi:hypothetical protein
MLAQGHTKGSTPRAHQQDLTIGPFRNTYKANAVSPEATMGGLQDIDVYNQGECQVNLALEQYNMHIYHLSAHIYSSQLSIRSNIVIQVESYQMTKTEYQSHTTQIYVVHPLSRATSKKLFFIMC